MKIGKTKEVDFVIYVFLLDATPLKAPDMFNRALTLVSVQRQQKVMRYRFLSDRVMSLGAGLLLDAGLVFLGISPRQAEISVDERGKLWSSSHPEISFNLSHSGGMVAGVFSNDGHVGIDIERMRKTVPLGVAERFFHPDEQKRLFDIRDEKLRRDVFFRIWTLKESYVKASGTTLERVLVSCALPPGTVQMTHEGKNWYFREYAVPGWKIAVCAQKKTLPRRAESLSVKSIFY